MRIRSKKFSLSVRHRANQTEIMIRFFTKNLYTNNLPATAVLKTFLPQILEQTCYNEDRLPFAKEVDQTEIGHLFEHIMLEYLCRLKLAQGYKKVTYRGETSWDWEKEDKGTFHIKIDATENDQPIFSKALKKSLNLLGLIIQKDLLPHIKPDALALPPFRPISR